jgi:hypothetical protein
VAVIRAHALQLIQGCADLQIGHGPLSLPARMPVQVVVYYFLVEEYKAREYKGARTAAASTPMRPRARL